MKVIFCLVENVCQGSLGIQGCFEVRFYGKVQSSASGDGVKGVMGLKGRFQGRVLGEE